MVFLDGVKFVYHWSWIFFSYRGVIDILFYFPTMYLHVQKMCYSKQFIKNEHCMCVGNTSKKEYLFSKSRQNNSNFINPKYCRWETS